MNNKARRGNSKLTSYIGGVKQKARVYTENTSDAWHIPRYPTRKHCITNISRPLTRKGSRAVNKDNNKSSFLTSSIQLYFIVVGRKPNFCGSCDIVFKQCQRNTQISVGGGGACGEAKFFLVKKISLLTA